MRVRIAAVGRLKGGPEADLTEDYLRRAGQTGRPLGLGPFELNEVEAKSAGERPREAALLQAACGAGALRILLDERGEAWTSRGLAERIGRWRDQGAPEAAFLIGGPDGHDPTLEGAHRLALGPQTWPHRLVRAMLAEQLYRATTILAGGPYHRD